MFAPPPAGAAAAAAPTPTAAPLTALPPPLGLAPLAWPQQSPHSSYPMPYHQSQMRMAPPPPPPLLPHTLAYPGFAPLPALPPLQPSAQHAPFHPTPLPPFPFSGMHYYSGPPPPMGFPVGFQFDPPPPASPSVAIRLRHAQATVPGPGGFYESATISSTMRTRALSGAHTYPSSQVLAPVEPISVRSIDILSPRAHHLSDASEVMTKPTLTKLNAYQERHPIKITLHRKQSASSSRATPTTGVPASPLSSPIQPHSGMSDNSGHPATPPRRPASSAFFPAAASPRRLAFNERPQTQQSIRQSPPQSFAPLMTQPAPPHISLLQLQQTASQPQQPIQSTFQIRVGNQHQRSNSSQLPPSHSVSVGQSPPSPLSAPYAPPKQGPFALRGNLFPTAAAVAALAHPPVSFHPINRHKHRRREASRASAKRAEESKSADEHEDPTTLTTMTRGSSDPTDDLDTTPQSYTSDPSRLGSTAQSEAVSVQASPYHSRDPSTDMHSAFASHQQKGSLAADSSASNTEAESSDEPSVEPAPTRAAPAISDLPPVPESGASLEGSLTASQRQEFPQPTAAASPPSVPLFAPVQPPHPAGRPSLSLASPRMGSTPLDMSVLQEGTLDTSALTRAEESKAAAAGPKKFTMESFWAMHDHAGEHDSPDTDSEAEEAAAEARRRALHDKNSSDTEEDKFDSNPHAVLLQRRAKAASSRRKAGQGSMSSQQFLAMQQDSSTDSEEENERLKQRESAAPPLKFITGAKKARKKAKQKSADVGKSNSKSSSKASGQASPAVAAASAAELLSASLSHMARAQMQAEVVLRTQKSRILGWFSRAQGAVQSKKQQARASQQNGAQAQQQAAKEATDLAEAIKTKAAEIKALREAKRTRIVEEQKAAEEREAREKVFAMLGGKAAVQQAAEQAAAAAGVDPPPPSALLQSPATTLFTSSDLVMSYIEIEHLLSEGRGAQPSVQVYQHLLKMEAAGNIQFASPRQLQAAVKVLSLPIEVTNLDMVHHEIQLANLPATAEMFVLKHSEVELEMHRVLKLSKARKRNSKRRSRQAKRGAERAVPMSKPTAMDGEQLLAVDEGIEPSSLMNSMVHSKKPATPRGPASGLPAPTPALLQHMKAQQLIFEDHQAREELLERLTIVDNNVLFDGDNMLTPAQVEQLIEAGKGSKPTLRHIVQMEVEQVKFSDPTQLISAVQVLTLPAELEYNEKLLSMDLIQSEVNKRHLPDSAQRYVLKHSEVDIELNRFEINLKRRSGKQMTMLMAMESNQPLTSADRSPRRFKESSASAQQNRSVAKEANLVTLSNGADEDTAFTVELVDNDESELEAQARASSQAPDFFNLSPEAQEKERMRIEEELARREVHKRLLPSSVDSRLLSPHSGALSGADSARKSMLFADGSTAMTQLQVDKLIEVGRGSKPTLRHIVQMEVEKVQFNDPMQLITAVAVLSVPTQSTQFNLERIEREITQGRVKLPASAVEYVMKHSEVELEMHQVRVIGLALSGNAASGGGLNFMAEMQSTLASQSAALKTAQVTTLADDSEGMMLVLEDDDAPVLEGADALEQLRDEVARAEVHLRLENARSKLFKAQHTRMTSGQVDELIDQGNGGQPTLRHIVEMEVEQITFEDPQQLISAVKVMNLPIAAKRASQNGKEQSSEVCTRQDVAAAALAADLPHQITEYVLKHSDVQLELAKVVHVRPVPGAIATPVPVAHSVFELAHLDLDSSLPWDTSFGARSPTSSVHSDVDQMRSEMVRMEREIQVLQSEDASGLMEEWVVSEEGFEQAMQAQAAEHLLQLPLSTAQSRRSSLLTFEMTPQLVEELIEETQAGDYLVTHLEKMSRSGNQGPFHTKDELVAAVTQEHAAYMEVEAHARLEVHHRLEHDRPQGVFKHGATMAPKQVEQLIEHGHGAVPTLKHIVKMEHSQVKFKEPTELISAVKVLAQPIREATLEGVSHDVIAARLPPEASKYIMQVMAMEMQISEHDIAMDQVEVEQGGHETDKQTTPGPQGGSSSSGRTAQAGPFGATTPASAPAHSPHSSASPLHFGLGSSHRRSLIAHPRVLSPGFEDMIEEQMGEASRLSNSSRSGRRDSETLNAARRAHVAGVTPPSYLQPAVLPLSPHSGSSGRPANPNRHSLGVLPASNLNSSPPSHASGALSNPSSLHNTLDNSSSASSNLNRHSLGKFGPSQHPGAQANASSGPPSPSHSHFQSSHGLSPRPAVRLEAELTMVDDDPTLMRAGNVSRSHSRLHSAHRHSNPTNVSLPLQSPSPTHSGHQHTIQIRPAHSYQASPVISLHNTINASQLRAGMAGEESAGGGMTIGVTEDERFVRFQGSVDFDGMRASPVPIDRALTPVQWRADPVPRVASPSASFINRRMSPSPDAEQQMHPQSVPQYMPAPRALSPRLTHRPLEFSGSSSTLEVHRPTEIRRFSLTTPMNVSQDITPGSTHDTIDSAATSPAHKPMTSAGGSPHSRSQSTAKLPFDGPPLSDRPSSLPSGHLFASPPPFLRVVSPHILSVPLPHSGNNSLTNTMTFGANGAGVTSGHNSPSSRSPSHSPAMRPFMVMVTEPSRHPSKDTSRAQSPTKQITATNNAQSAEAAVNDSSRTLDSKRLQESLLDHSLRQEREQAQELARLQPWSEVRSSTGDASVMRSSSDTVADVHAVASLHSELPSLALPDAPTPPMHPLAGHRHADSTGAMSESSMMQLQSSPISPGEVDSGTSSPSVSRQHTLHRPGSLLAGIAVAPTSPQAGSPRSAGSPLHDSQHNSGSQHTRRLGAASGSPHSGSPLRSPSPPAQTPPIGSTNSQTAVRQVTLLSLASSSVAPVQPSSPLRGAVKSRIANDLTKRDSKKGSPKQSPKTTPKQTPKSSPSQSLQPTPMHSLSVTPSASPRSSGGAMAYSNMAATVSSKARTGSGLSAPATAVVRIAGSDPAPAPPAVVRRTSLTVPNAAVGLSGSASATTLSIPSARHDPRRLSTGGTPLSDVREKEFDVGTASPRDSATGLIAGSSRSSTSSVHSTTEEARVEIERRKSEILAFNAEVANVTAPPPLATAAIAPTVSPPPSPSPFPAAAAASVAPGSGSKRAPRRTNTMAEWSEHDDEALRLSARGKKPAATKQHRKAGSVMTASYLQPTMSSSGAIAVPSTRDSTSPLPSLPPSSPSSASGYVPSFMQPTQSHAVKFGRPAAAPSVRQRRPSNAGATMAPPTQSTTDAPRRRRRESKLLGPGELPIDETAEESTAGSGSARHKRTGSVDEPVDEEDDAAGSNPLPQSIPSSVRSFSTPMGSHAHHSIDFGRVELERTKSVEKDTAEVDSASSGATQPSPASTAAPVLSVVVSSPMKRTPWQPSVPLSLLPVLPSSTPSSSPRSLDSDSHRRLVSQPLPLARSTTLTEEELAHQAEIDRVRGENERRRKAKELAALQEAARLQALANDPAEQLRLRRDKRKNEFRNRKHAEHSAEEARKLAEEAQARADAERSRLARDRAELLEAELAAAKSRADTERLVAERVAKELERKNKIIEEFERKRAEEADQRRQQEEAERIANIPKYLVTGTVAAAARMLDNARAAAVRGGDASAAESAAEYLEKMRARSEVMRENAALKRAQLDAAKATLLHTRDDQFAAHIAEIRRNKAELFESEKAQLELYTAEKERKAAENLRQLQADSDADVAAKHAELQSKIKAAQSKHHASEADRARELESILREHEEEARRKAEYVSSKIDQLKYDKARENEIMMIKARGLKEMLLEQQEEELRVLVEQREQMREKATANQSGPNAYTPKVGIDYFAEHDLLHLSGLPANHPMMLQAGISKIDEQTGAAVWQANQSQMQLTNVGSSAPASYATATTAGPATTQQAAADRSALDSVRFAGPGSPIRSMRANTVTAREPGQSELFANLDLHSFSGVHSRRAK